MKTKCKPNVTFRESDSAFKASPTANSDLIRSQGATRLRRFDGSPLRDTFSGAGGISERATWWGEAVKRKGQPFTSLRKGDMGQVVRAIACSTSHLCMQNWLSEQVKKKKKRKQDLTNSKRGLGRIPLLSPLD